MLITNFVTQDMVLVQNSKAREPETTFGGDMYDVAIIQHQYWGADVCKFVTKTGPLTCQFSNDLTLNKHLTFIIRKISNLRA